MAPRLGADEARTLAVGIAGARVGLGLAALVAPRAALRPWVGASTDGAASAVLGRALGGRDVALGLGALLAARRHAPLRGWVEGAALSDWTDTAATLVSFRRLPRVGRWLVLAASAGSAVTSVVVAPSL